MENNNQNYKYDNVIQIEDNTARKFMASVFMWMFVALGISAGVALAFANTPSLLALLFEPTTGTPTGLTYICMFAPLIFVLVMRFGLNSLSYGALAAIYVAYAAVTGMSLSVILLIYTTTSVAAVFITASLLFGLMAVVGYTTNTDLTKFGSLMIMGVIGLIIASVVNWFMHSEQLSYIISFFGVAIFIGLTAYDVQKMKRIAAGLQYGDASAGKLALMGGLSLYLDFVNLFLYLLRLFGRRK